MNLVVPGALFVLSASRWIHQGTRRTTVAKSQTSRQVHDSSNKYRHAEGHSIRRVHTDDADDRKNEKRYVCLSSSSTAPAPMDPINRRSTIAQGVLAALCSSALVTEQSLAMTTTTGTPPSSAKRRQRLQYFHTVTDPNTYSALVYAPPTAKAILFVLHGAGRNDNDNIFDAFTQEEHRGLAPSLLYEENPPDVLVDDFVVVAPYVGDGKLSFYDDPRSKLLQFIDWIVSPTSDEHILVSQSSPQIDWQRKYLFGFSDGATVAIELATTRRFQAVAIAAYGFSGILPDRALALLADLPIWVFHSADDVIFPVQYSDRLVKALRARSSTSSIIRYTRYDQDQEGFTGNVRGHSTGITASKLPELYSWMLSIPAPLSSSPIGETGLCSP